MKKEGGKRKKALDVCYENRSHITMSPYQKRRRLVALDHRLIIQLVR